MSVSKKILTIAGAAVVLIGASANAADRWPNWYVGLHGSLSFIPEQDITQSNASLGEIDFDMGVGGGAALGYTPDNSPFRYELEYAYRRNDVDSINSNGSSGRYIKSSTLMLNVFYDFVNGQQPFTPYVGAGVGAAKVSLNVPSISTDDSDSSVAYQLMAGISYEPVSLPDTEWSIGYRFFDLIGEPEFGPNSSRTEMDFHSHNIEVGGRFKF